MMPGKISAEIVVDRLEWIDRMLAGIRSLPLNDRDMFFADPRNLATAESYLRRALEALLDLGRHILAKGFGKGVDEYKQIATRLGEEQVLTSEEANLLFTMAGFRNRLVHFYHEVEPDELYFLCRDRLTDIEKLAHALRAWSRNHR